MSEDKSVIELDELKLIAGRLAQRLKERDILRAVNATDCELVNDLFDFLEMFEDVEIVDW